MLRHYKVGKVPGFEGPNKAISFLLLLGLSLLCLPGWAQDEETEEEFKGVGIHLRLRGAWAMFSGGDLKKGTSGMYDQSVDDLDDYGFEAVSSDKESLDWGYEFTGDLVYYLSPKLGLGIGGGWLRSSRGSIFRFSVPGSILDYTMVSAPKLDVTSIRLGVFYALQLNRLLTVCLNAGPAYYLVSFQYVRNITTPADQDFILQDVDARSLGFEGGIGLEIRMNQRLAFILEAQGRFAKVSGFEGKESIYRVIWEPVFSGVENGILSYVEDGEFPRLDIFPDGPPAGVSAEEAQLDLTGISFQAGLNFKF